MITSENIQIITSTASVVSTAVLLCITYKQMKWAKMSVKEMENSIKADFLPVLILGLRAYSSTDNILNISLTNCGKGIAIKPKIIFPGQPDVTINSLDVGTSDNVIIRYNIDFILQKNEEHNGKITIEYRDIFGRLIKTEALLKEVNHFGTDSKKRGIGWDSWNPIIP